MITFDGMKAMESALASSLGLPDYAYIMANIYRTDISQDMEFQKRFNYFYKVRRELDWRKKFYQLFERNKQNKNVTFENILCNLYVFTNRTEPSFASKMLATINPDMPIWDSRVLKFLGLKLEGQSDSARQDSAIQLYGEISAWYDDYINTENAKDNIHIFDRLLPEYSWLSNVKKIDYMIWSLGDYQS